MLFALGRGHLIDGSFGKVYPRHGTPSKAIICCAVVTAIAACLGKGALIAFIDVGSFCIAVAFLGVSVSLIVLRWRAPELHRPYRLPYGSLVAGMAAGGSIFILGAMILPKSPVTLTYPLEWSILTALCLSSGLVWTLSRKTIQGITEVERGELILKTSNVKSKTA